MTISKDNIEVVLIPILTRSRKRKLESKKKLSKKETIMLNNYYKYLKISNYKVKSWIIMLKQLKKFMILNNFKF
mgnify:CR=1 FL=1